MSAAWTEWHEGPRAPLSRFLYKVHVGVVREGSSVGVRIELVGTKGRARLVLGAAHDLPGAIAVLTRLRDACDQALRELGAGGAS